MCFIFICVRMSVFIKHRCHFVYILNGRLMQFNMEMTFYGILSHTITSISFLNNTNFRNLYCTWWRWYDHLTVIALFLLVGSEGGKRRWKRKAKHNNTIVMLHRWLIRMTVAYKASMSCFTNVMLYKCHAGLLSTFRWISIRFRFIVEESRAYGCGKLS